MRQKTVIAKLLQSVTDCYYKVRQVLQSVTDCYYKVRQVLQSVTDCYYKVRQVLQSVTDCYYKVRQLLQSVTGCYYKVRQLLQTTAVITKWDIIQRLRGQRLYWSRWRGKLSDIICCCIEDARPGFCFLLCRYRNAVSVGQYYWKAIRRETARQETSFDERLFSTKFSV